MRLRPTLLLSAGLLFFAIVTAPARVFWTNGRGETGGVLSADPAWTRAYATMLKINNGRGGLEVWNASLGLQDAALEIRRRVQDDGGCIWLTGEGDMAWGIGYVGDRVIRMLLVAGDGPRQSLVYQLSQTIEDFQASLVAPETHRMKAAPAFPGGKPKSFLGSENTGLEMASSEVPVPGAAAQDYYAKQLPSAGWAPAFKPGKGADLYLRDREMLLVSAKSTGEAGGCLLMLLYKPLSSGAAR